MEAVAVSTLKAIDVLTVSNDTRRTSNTRPRTLTPLWLSTKPQLLVLHASLDVPQQRKISNANPNPFLARCSTTPDIDSDSSTTSKSPTVESGSNSETPQQSTYPQPAQTHSASFSRGLVFDLGSENSWDCAEIGSPVVKRYLGDDQERWYMWYYGRLRGFPAADSIGLAVSSNGVHWERGAGPVQSSGDVGLVLNCSRDWWAFDTQSIRPAEVVIMSSSKVRTSSAVYWLYYSGFSSEKVEVSAVPKLPFKNPERANDDDDGSTATDGVFKSLPGLAISQDGRHWARIEGEHHTGALIDVGSDGEWDSLFIAAPHVVFHSSRDLRMYYHSYDAKCGHFSVGIARSKDGIRWLKLGKIIGGGADGSFDELGIINAHVVRNQKDGVYLMAYEGVAADGRRSIGLAVSPDGLQDWRRCQDEAVLNPSSQDGWDNRGVGSPCLVQMGGDANEWRLYYRGIGNGGRTGIGMAISGGKKITEFRRWTGFQL